MAEQQGSMSREQALDAIREKLEIDPELRRGLQTNLQAAIERAGLTEQVRRLREELADGAERCIITCGFSCSWTGV